MISGSINIPKPTPASITQGTMHNSKPSWAESDRLRTYSMMNNKECAPLALTLSSISAGAEPVVRRPWSEPPSATNTLFLPTFFLYQVVMKTDAVCFVLTPAAVMSPRLLPGCEMHLRQLCFHSAVVAINSAAQQQSNAVPAHVNQAHTVWSLFLSH